MKFKVVPNSCRTCLQKSKKLRSIFKPMEEGEEPPHEMLKIITGIIVDESADTGKLPVYICKDCILSLNMAYELRAKALKSQLIIETYFNLQKLSTEEEEVMEIEKVETFDTAFSDEDKIDYLQVQFDAIYNSIDEEPLDSMQEELSVACDNADEVDDALDSDYADIVKAESSQELSKISNSEDNREFKEKAISKEPSRRGRKRIYDIGPPRRKEKFEPDGESTQEEPLPKEKLTSKVDNGVGHICDICGNIYTKRFRMLEHRQGHDLELRHTCELCGKKFHLRERLRKHMYAHKDKKPHKCSFCSRTFFFESLKRSHEAIHQGSKPHVCQVCNKAFAYSQALKNHQLIHAEIKYHHCNYCNKDFRLQHHLKQHEETKLHQNAVKTAELSNRLK